MRVGIDTGGTFTDAVVVASDPDGTARVGLGKALSTPGDLTVGANDGVQSYAVSLLWSVAEPRHEARIAELIAQIHPGAHVSLSSAAPRIGEYERTMSAVLDAYVAPLVAKEVQSLADVLADRGFNGTLQIMQSSGSTRAVDAALRPVETLQSGPVAGLTASVGLVGRLGRTEAIATDVGGTSFDVGLVTDGQVTMASRPMIGRWALAHPVVEVVSIGTGGGSLAWIDPVLGSLRVGPQSAGARPGPACYRRGGTAPTLTDAAEAEVSGGLFRGLAPR